MWWSMGHPLCSRQAADHGGADRKGVEGLLVGIRVAGEGSAQASMGQDGLIINEMEQNDSVGVNTGDQARC